MILRLEEQSRLRIILLWVKGEEEEEGERRFARIVLLSMRLERRIVIYAVYRSAGSIAMQPEGIR